MIIQRLVKNGTVFRLETVAICAEHFDRLSTADNVCWKVESSDPCELCRAEQRQSDAEHEARQEGWLRELFSDCGKAGLEAWRFTVYLAGPMSGIPQSNKPAFHRMERMLSRFGFHVLSPANYDGEHTYEWYMEQDIRKLLDARAVVLLSGWQGSVGATLEYSVANITKRKIYYEV